MELRGGPFVAQAQITLEYKDRTLKRRHPPDFISFDTRHHSFDSSDSWSHE